LIAIVTGAYGFAGANLVEHLLSKSFKVYAVGRKSSSHNDRFKGAAEDQLVPVFLEMEDYDKLPSYVTEKVDFFFHLAWGGGREDFEAQLANVQGALKALEAAAQISKDIRFVGIGSQAEYGVKTDCELITEDMTPDPFSAYGSCKAAAYYLLRNRAKALGIDFIWGRVFSLFGKYEESGRMIPDLVARLSRGEKMKLSSCEQDWDYLDAVDAAGAMLALAQRGVAGEAYNIANGAFRPLKNFVQEVIEIVGCSPDAVEFGAKATPFISLRPSVEKITADTGWKPVIPFGDTIRELIR
jgi:nucleoside-diphosphate-sugar epimerase